MSDQLDEPLANPVHPLSKATLPNWLRQRALLTPRRVAIEYRNQTVTFAELYATVLETAGALVRCGVHRGDRVAFLLQNGWQLPCLVHAVSEAGAVSVPLNTRLTRPELVWQMEDAGVKLCIYDTAHAEQAELIAEQIKEKQPHMKLLDVNDIVRMCKQALPDERKENRLGAEQNLPLHHGTAHTSAASFRTEYLLDDTHTILYTSGTTGRPKGVQLTYGNHWWSAIGSMLNLGLREDDSWLVCLPMFHMGGLSILMRGVIYGMKVVILDRFDERAVNEELLRKRVSIVSVVNTMLQRMIEHLDAGGSGGGYPETLRCILLGGGPANRALLEKCAARSIPVFQSFGMTETASQTVTLAPEDALHKIGSAGKPLFPAQIKIVKDGRQLSPGEVGEVVVKGPNVMRGYWQRPEANRRTLREGWLYTGDLGYVDEEGYLYVVDRRQDLIISGGENVYPAEIEAVLNEHPAVLEAGVTGVKSEKWGHVPVAFVRCHPAQSTDETVLLQHCAQRLARYKLPVRIYFVKQPLPRNAMNKLLRRKLPDLLDQ
jgi:o-succinylbenzoate---CoA ligase